jgi:hypothetical protein
MDQYNFEDGDAMAIFERFLDEEWREATPCLKEVTYGLRNKGEYTVGYWDNGEKRRELRALCRGQSVVDWVVISPKVKSIFLSLVHYTRGYPF